MLEGYSLGKLLELECQGTKSALLDKKVSCLDIKFSQLTPGSVAAYMIVYFDLVIAIAKVLNIDPFDQPGVESSAIFNTIVVTVPKAKMTLNTLKASTFPGNTFPINAPVLV